MNYRKHKNISLLAAGLIVICLLVTVGCRKKTEPASPSAASTAAPDDERTVRRLANEFIAAIGSDDTIPLTRLEEIFADDICQITMEGKVIQGKQNNLFFYRSRQKKNQAKLRSRTVRYDIRSVEVSCDLAVIFGEVEVEKWGKNAPEPYRGSFWETLVFRKIDGKWRLVQEQSTQPKPAKKQRGTSKGEKPAAGEQENISSPFIGFGAGAKGASDDTNKPIIFDSNDEEQDEVAIPEAEELSPEQTRNIEENIRGSFSGIGVSFDANNPNGLYVKKVFPGSPADNAGINDGEIITAVDGESTVGMSAEHAVSLIKGTEGTKVDLKILSNNGTQRDASVVRGTVVITGVESRIVEPNIGLLVISAFNQETAAKVRDALMYFQQQNIRGLVLDLRNNQGGLFPAAIEITGMFIGPDKIICQVQNIGQTDRILKKGSVQKMAQWPVVVLINSETRSGAEILASAIRSGTGGKLLGQKTFGKGSMRTIKKERDGTSRKVTVGYLCTADGQTIEGQGINPDKELDPELSSEETLKQAVYELTREVEKS